MKRSILSGNISKEYILKNVSQVSIFSKYLNLPEDIIQHCIDTGDLICSPIRIDRNPTVGFRYNNKGKLKMRDFAGYFHGDCFDIVAYILNQLGNKISVENKQDFIKILRHITFTFKDIFYGDEIDSTLTQQIKDAIDTSRNTKTIIDLVVRNWNEYDEIYWKEIGVNLQHLNLNFVYPIEQYYINKNINPEPKYYYKVSDPCYAYFLGKDRNNVNNIKLYFPNRDKHSASKFITNCNHLEGIYNLDRNDYNYIVITKSSKDRLSIGCTIQSIFPYGEVPNIKIGVINIPHETYKLRNNEYDWLKSKLTIDGKIVSLMDNDKVGILEANWLRRNYNIIPIFIPITSGCKDFAEYRAKNSITIISENIKQSINYINNYESIKDFWYKKKNSSKPF